MFTINTYMCKCICNLSSDKFLSKWLILIHIVFIKEIKILNFVWLDIKSSQEGKDYNFNKCI